MEDNIEVNATSSIFIPIAIGLAGIILGAVSLYFSFSGPNRLQEEAHNRENRIEAVERYIGHIEENQKIVNARVNHMMEQLQSLKKETIAKAKLVQTCPVSAGEVHVIESGDTFAKLAQRYGVSLAVLIEKNPDLDPRVLQIGQKVIIPSP